MYSLLAIPLLHFTLQPHKSKWVHIHFWVNMIITWLTWSTVVDFFACPLCDHQSHNLTPSLLVLALHLYHVGWYPCVRLDYIHHIVMCSLLVIPLLAGEPAIIAFCNFVLFFMCGLPGGIDYFNMYLVYTDRLAGITEKRINSWLNIWLRAPGILFATFICWTKFMTDGLPLIYVLPCLLAFFWNAQYFSREVCISYGRHSSHSAGISS